MELITLEQMREAIKAAVAERGEDFVYPEEWKDGDAACLYRLGGGTPACIVGLAAYKINPNIRLREGAPAYSVLHRLATRDACIYAQKAQAIQDEGGTWGEALVCAEEWVSDSAQSK